MSWSGSYYRGARRDYRARKRAAALTRQQAQQVKRVERRGRQSCPGKQRYRNRAVAELALLDCRIRRVIRRQQRRQERRAYYCHGCGAHHLTSQPDLRIKEIVTA